MTEAINHPVHYNRHPSGVECIDLVEEMNFNLGNAVKYLWRAGLKSSDSLEDLKKALWYTEREIGRAAKIACFSTTRAHLDDKRKDIFDGWWSSYIAAAVDNLWKASCFWLPGSIPRNAAMEFAADQIRKEINYLEAKQ